MRRRLEYRLELPRYEPVRPSRPKAICEFRHPAQDDVFALATLMIDAYRGTIDDDGETLEDALEEVNSYFDGPHGRPILNCSWLCICEDELAAACLVSWWSERGYPIISYIMTAAKQKKKGLGTAILAEALSSLSDQGHKEIGAVITFGNRPSEIIFERAGFEERT